MNNNQKLNTLNIISQTETNKPKINKFLPSNKSKITISILKMKMKINSFYLTDLM